jgi:hypothetical protein
MADPVAYKYTITSGQNLIAPYWSSVLVGLQGENEINFSEPNYGGYLNFRNGYQATDGVNYVLYSDDYSQGVQGEQQSALPVAWTCDANEGAFINLMNAIPARHRLEPFATKDDAISWMVAENKYLLVNKTYPEIAYSNCLLQAAYDPSYSGSYPISGANIYDISGCETTYPAVMVSNGTVTSIIPEPYKYFDFPEGVQSYCEIPASLLQRMIAANDLEFSLCIWFNIGSSAAFPKNLFRLTAGSGAPDSDWFRVYVAEGTSIEIRTAFNVNENSQSTATVVDNVELTRWHFLTATFRIDPSSNNLTYRFYFNSVQTLSNSFGISAPSVLYTSNNGELAHYIGAESNNPPGFFNGFIGGFYIYSGALTQQNIEDIFNKTKNIYS